MSRILFHATHHPRPEHVDDLLAAMSRLSATAHGVAGLDEIGAFTDEGRETVIAISVWESMEALQAGMQQLFAGLGDLPFDQWESRPRELLTLTEVGAAVRG